MDVETVIKILQEVKAAHPALSNDEILKLMILKALLDGNARGHR